MLDRLDPGEIHAARGGILCVRETPGTARWRRLIGSREGPAAGRRVATVLSGKTSRDIGGLGACYLYRFSGREFGLILLDDPHPEEAGAIAAAFRRFVPRAYPPRVVSGVLGWMWMAGMDE